MFKNNANTTLVAILLLAGILVIILGSVTQQMTGACKQSTLSWEAMFEWLFGAAIIFYAAWILNSEYGAMTTFQSATVPPHPAPTPPPVPPHPAPTPPPVTAMPVPPNVTAPMSAPARVQPVPLAVPIEPRAPIPKPFARPTTNPRRHDLVPIAAASPPPAGKQWYQIPSVLG